MKWDLSVVHAGVYRHAQKHEQVARYFFVGFAYSGLKFMKIPGCEPVTACPLLMLRPLGSSMAFEFGPNRENWVVFVQTPDVRQGLRDGRVELRCEDQWIDVPWHLPVEPAMSAWWQSHFMHIHDLVQSPTPSNRLLAEMHVIHVIQRFLTPSQQAKSSPEQRLKTLIDHDLTAARTLSTLAQQCGYSADHLRLRFEQRYGLSPIAYRQRRRMVQAMELITRSGRTIKQIASALGFTQVAHFCAAFRQTYAMTPGEAMGKFRHH